MNRKLSHVELGVLSITGGLLLTSLGMPIFPMLLQGVGIGSMMQGLLKRNGKIEKLFDVLGLYTGKENKQYPKIKETRKTEYGECIRISTPVGLCSKDFEKHEVALKEHFRAEDININFENGWIFLQLHKEKLKNMYEYTGVDTRNILEVPVAYDVSGLITVNIAEGPHMLVAGETGSGKSTTLRNIITYLIQKKSEYGVKLHLIDLKEGVEFSVFRKSSVVKSFSKNIQEAESVLRDIMGEVKKRYSLFFDNDCVDISEYNKRFKKKKLNYEVCVIDEFADFHDEKESIALLEELLAKARACGIHFIISTQRPDSKILNGRLKANVPYVVGLKTMNEVNSRIIIDEGGLEKLKGNGHAIIKTDRLIEAQCIHISTEQARDIVRPTYAREKAIFKPREAAEVAEIKDFRFLEVLGGVVGE